MTGKLPACFDHETYSRSLAAGSMLGSAIGSLYPAVLGMSLFDSFSIGSFLMFFAAAVFISCPLLMIGSNLIGGHVVGWLVRYSRQRILVFAMGGGITGLVVFSLCFAVFLVLKPGAKMPDRETAAICFQVATVVFCYTALTGALTAIDLGSKVEWDERDDPP